MANIISCNKGQGHFLIENYKDTHVLLKLIKSMQNYIPNIWNKISYVFYQINAWNSLNIILQTI